jgi:hypothetical protein
MNQDMQQSKGKQLLHPECIRNEMISIKHGRPGSSGVVDRPTGFCLTAQAESSPGSTHSAAFPWSALFFGPTLSSPPPPGSRRSHVLRTNCSSPPPVARRQPVLRSHSLFAGASPVSLSLSLSSNLSSSPSPFLPAPPPWLRRWRTVLCRRRSLAVRLFFSPLSAPLRRCFDNAVARRRRSLSFPLFS